jgi:hypothetical protein
LGDLALLFFLGPLLLCCTSGYLLLGRRQSLAIFFDAVALTVNEMAVSIDHLALLISERTGRVSTVVGLNHEVG